MTGNLCNGCDFLHTVECSAKNVPTRIMYVCYFGGGAKIVKVRKKISISEHPPRNFQMVSELEAMIEIVDVAMSGWAKTETKPQWVEAWRRLKQRLGEVERPGWCERI